MAVYSNGTKTKKQLVSATLAALKDTWALEIKVRDIARACDVSPATVYRHFDSMDHLIAVASVGFVEEFSKSFRALINEGKNIMDIYMGTWTFFNKYAFKRPDVYYPLFWGESNNVFGSAPHDYYELFPVPDSDDWEDKLNTYLA